MWKVRFLALAGLLVFITAPVSVHGQSPTGEVTPEPGTFMNPVLDRDFPDPDVLQVGDVYYAYATNALGMNVQVARSTDLVTWEFLYEAMPGRPAWSVPSFGYVWAPEVTTFDGETFLMYFVARFDDGAGGRQCLGMATSPVPEGPFTPLDEAPIVCQLEQGGSIDPSVFVDVDGAPYLLWKNDGNAIGEPTWVYIQPLSADGLTLEGQPTALITADQPWEGTLVEAPILWLHDGQYVLFYSANAYGDARYAVGYARSDSLLGPYEKPEAPMLETSIPNGIVGPGGQDVVTDAEGADWLLLHGWGPNNYRRLYLAPLEWMDDGPVVSARLNAPLPVPAVGGA